MGRLNMHINKGRGTNLRWSLLCLSSLSTFAELLQGHLKHRIILVPPRFSTFASLVRSHLKASNYFSFSLLLYSGQFGSRSEPRATWQLVAVFWGLLFSARLCWLYNLLYANSRGHPSMWTRLLAYQPITSAGGLLVSYYIRKQVYFVFIFRSSATSFLHATHTIYVACQKGSSSRYPTVLDSNRSPL